MSAREVRTFCRICEAHCGLLAQVDPASGRVLRVLPDRDHPVSKGYCCVKGLSLGELHHDPDRLNFPLKRTSRGFERIGWEQAIIEIGERVRGLRARHGPRSIAMYRGNPSFFSFQHYLFASAYLDALGSPNAYTSVSIDCNPKFFVAQEIYGSPLIQPVPDLAHAELFICLGSNPVVSQMSILQLPNALARLKQIEARGGRVVVVDPRKTETALRVGEHLFVRPGTDAYLLMGMLHVLVHELGVDVERAERHANGVRELISACRPFPPERVARVTGIDADRVRELARSYGAARGACIYVSTGVTMGPFGTLSCWLVQGLSLLAGHLDQRGGCLVPRGAFDLVSRARRRRTERTLVGGYPAVAGAFPVACLAEEIEVDDPRRVRALIVTGGNPLHSVPGPGLSKALERLDLLVCIDVYRSETCARADYALPATDMLEHSDFPLGWMLLQETPYAQFTEAVVPALAERRDEWRIFSDLSIASGISPFGKTVCNVLPWVNRVLRRLPGQREITPDAILAKLLKSGNQVTLDQLRASPEGVLLEPHRPGDFLGRRVPTDSGRVELASPAILGDVSRLDRLEPELSERRPGWLRMIGRRERQTHNSWMHNLKRVGARGSNVALLSPDDAAELGIASGQRIEIAGQEGRLTLPVEVTDTLMPGVVAVPHGWGHQRAATSRASALSGENFNSAIAGGGEHVEPPSGQAVILGHWVSVRPAPGTVGLQTGEGLPAR